MAEAIRSTVLFQIVMYPSFAMGHLIPFLHLSNKLASRGHRISFLVPNKLLPKLKPLNLFPNLISFIPLQVPHVNGLPLGAETTSDVPSHLGHLLATAFDLTHNQIELILSKLKPHFIFYDFAHWVPKIARRLGIKSIFFSVSGPAINGYSVPNYGVEMGKQITAEDLLNPPPGAFLSSSSFTLPPFLLSEASFLLHQEFGVKITIFERFTKAARESDAISLRTCREIHGPFCDYMESQCRKSVLLTGPILPVPGSIEPLHEHWAKWLSSFKKGSVVYCAFGSECQLQKNQFQELLLGLELTGLPFLVALRPPIGVETMEEALPEGLEERVRGRGVIHGGWVQQELILEHPSVGCFVSHCGYGSMWESLVRSDCQIVLVPQILEQFLNAQLMSGELKVAVEVERREEDGWFSRESFCRAVKLVMEEGSQVRNELRESHAKWKAVFSGEGFESSYIDNFILNLGNQIMD